MKSPTIYKCSAEFAANWSQTLEAIGLVVEKGDLLNKVKSGTAVVNLVFVENGNVMFVFSAPLIIWGRNLRLAKQIQQVLLSAGLIY